MGTTGSYHIITEIVDRDISDEYLEYCSFDDQYISVFVRFDVLATDLVIGMGLRPMRNLAETALFVAVERQVDLRVSR